jgi:hypothetical protein
MRFVNSALVVVSLLGLGGCVVDSGPPRQQPVEFVRPPPPVVEYDRRPMVDSDRRLRDDHDHGPRALDDRGRDARERADHDRDHRPDRDDDNGFRPR